MATNPDDPTTPVACAAPKAPDLNADSCDPSLNYGPISNIYIGTDDPTAVFASDPPLATEIETRLALPLTDVKAVRLLIGTMTFGTANTATENFNGIDYPKPSIRNFPVETKDTSDKNYEFARSTQKGGYKGRVWGVSQDGQFIYGGINGLPGVLVLNNELNTDFTGINSIKGNLSVKGFFDPKRSASPVPAV